MNYSVDYFIKKFEAIPENEWCVNSFNKGGAKCANGHCGVRLLEDAYEFVLTEESVGLQNVFSILSYGGIKDNLGVYDGAYSDIAAFINNGEDLRYQQPHPKQRILAALYDIKKSQEQTKERTDITKELAVLPVDEKADIIENKILIKQ